MISEEHRQKTSKIFEKLVNWCNNYLTSIYIAYCSPCSIFAKIDWNLKDVKGQIISKRLFRILEFSQKTNEQIRRSSKNEFVRLFFGRIRGYQKSFRNYLTFMIFWICFEKTFC